MKRLLMTSGLILSLFGCSSPKTSSDDPCVLDMPPLRERSAASSPDKEPTYWRLYSISADRNPKTNQTGRFTFAIDHAGHFEQSQTIFETTEEEFLKFLHQLDPIAMVSHAHGLEVESQNSQVKQPSNLKILLRSENLLVVELKGFFRPESQNAGLGQDRSYQFIYLRLKPM